MKKLLSLAGITLVALCFASCSGGKKADQAADDQATADAEAATVEYTLTEGLPEVDLASFPVDADGWITIFDGKSFNGWRGYNRADMPAAWIIDEESLRIQGSGAGEAGASNGGDIIFAHKLKNFELQLEWKVGKGSNSGIFYLAQEIADQPIYISSPEFQVLDNENHPDARLGKDNNRKSASLYDMIPAVPQNAKPFGEWNSASITSYKGTIVHNQNGENVLEYHLWTPQWKELLDASKFSKDKWPLAYELLLNCGGENKEGYIGLQDHGDDVWFRNIKVKLLD
ncbi:MAG: DUF1080 domain-containing protein [Tannerellaceae bacterium]|jgi:hypothetical protein|nr:DUF1080 domain-containing protein [Tannerellaceae bacterium]